MTPAFLVEWPCQESFYHVQFFHGKGIFIRNHSSDSSFTIQEAAHFGYHPAYFGRLLKKEVGMSPSEILAKTRLEKSAVLLRHDTLTVSQIASACGFGNPYYFSREFKRFYGVPPSEYRKEESEPKN